MTVSKKNMRFYRDAVERESREEIDKVRNKKVADLMVELNRLAAEEEARVLERKKSDHRRKRGGGHASKSV